MPINRNPGDLTEVIPLNRPGFCILRVNLLHFARQATQTPAPQLIETPVDSNTNVEEIDPVVTEPTPAENTVPDKPRDYEEQETP